MIIVSADRANCAANIPLTTDAFHRNKRDRERLIIDSPAIIDAFAHLHGDSWCGKLSLRMDIWSDSYARIEGVTNQPWIGEADIFSWVYLTDTEIDLVLKSCYPRLKLPCERESYVEAFELEQGKRDCFLGSALLRLGFPL